MATGKMANNTGLTEVFNHIESGRKVTLVYRGWMRATPAEEWQESMTYVTQDTGECYTRLTSDFHQHFAVA